MNAWAALLTGIICAGVGGELFVRGAVGLARWARVSAGIIGATVAAFATSSPELSVAIGSSMAGKPEISLGDAVGSNVVNVALILGVVLCISPIRASRATLRREFPIALLVPVVLGILSWDHVLSRVDGILLLVLFFAWLTSVVVAARRERSASPKILGEARHGRALLESLVGLPLLVGAGHFIVMGARGVAAAFGIPECIIGATLVALGTSTPELATSIISKLRGHDEIGLGTILGSNVFNGLFIVGVAAVICPIRGIDWGVAIALIVGLITTTITFPFNDDLVGRRRGVILLAFYIVYVVALTAG